MVQATVIIYTHNPRPDSLRRLLDALKAQTLPRDQWNLWLVDKASKEPLADAWDLTWHSCARHIREDELGLTPASLHGIREFLGTPIVFLGEDNLLTPDFLFQVLAVNSACPKHDALDGSILSGSQPTPSVPSQLDYHGVTLQLDCLPEGMQNVLLSGGYEKAEISILPALVSPSDEVLEIGGAIGFLGLYCRKIIKVKSLTSVEPNPNTLSYLRRNYELNGLSPAVIEAAVAAADGPVSFHTSDMFWADSLVASQTGNGSKTITVQGLTFQSLAQRLDSKFNTLIIDIEGAEQFLPMDSIPDQVKKVLIEIHPEIIGFRSAYHVLETLIRAGFQVHGQHHYSWALIRS